MCVIRVVVGREEEEEEVEEKRSCLFNFWCGDVALSAEVVHQFIIVLA